MTFYSAVALRQLAEVEQINIMFWIYAIYNRSVDKYYIGQTANLEQRLKLHNSKEFKSSYTAKFGGKWELIYSEKII